MTAGKKVTLSPGQGISYAVDDDSSDEDLCYFDLYDFFMDGSVTSDQLIITYAQESSVEY